MNKLLKAIIPFVLLLAITIDVFSQNEGPVQFGADLMSRYIWRGVNLGGCSPVIQPWLKYKVTSKDTTHALSIGAWGSYTFSQTSNQELDLYLTYTFRNVISFSISDYFFPELYRTKDRSSYLNYDSDSTSHVFEGSISFNGTEKIPFTFFFAMNFYGNDARRVTSDGSFGNIFMTKYVEIGYKKNIRGVDFNAFIGATLDKPVRDRGELGYYGNKTAGVMNIGIKSSKAIQISDKYSLPIQVSLISNPEAEKIFLVFGMSF